MHYGSVNVMALMISKIKKVKAWILLTLDRNLIYLFGSGENCLNIFVKNVVPVDEKHEWVDWQSWNFALIPTRPFRRLQITFCWLPHSGWAWKQIFYLSGESSFKKRRHYNQNISEDLTVDSSASSSLIQMSVVDTGPGVRRSSVVVIEHVPGSGSDQQPAQDPDQEIQTHIFVWSPDVAANFVEQLPSLHLLLRLLDLLFVRFK